MLQNEFHEFQEMFQRYLKSNYYVLYRYDGPFHPCRFTTSAILLSTLVATTSVILNILTIRVSVNNDTITSFEGYSICKLLHVRTQCHFHFNRRLFLKRFLDFLSPYCGVTDTYVLDLAEAYVIYVPLLFLIL